MTPDCPETLLEAVRYFSDLTVCNRYMRQIKWPDGQITCPKCGADKIGEVATRHLLRCKACRKQFSYKVDTIFEDSPLGLDKWFVAIWCIANAKNGISSHELGRALGVTQKTAWFMLHRIREAMKTKSFRKLQGEVESDETFIGGKAANMHADKRETKIKGRGATGKSIVHGLLERGGEARTKVVSSTEADVLRPIITKEVDHEATVDGEINMNLEWMKSICVAEARHPVVSNPWTFDIDGAPWSVATDGTVLVAVRIEVGFAKCNHRAGVALSGLLDSAIQFPLVGHVALSSVKEWCASLDLYSDCEECDGSGEVFCVCCNRDGADCGKCGGDGRIMQFHDGTIFGVLVNRAKLGQAIEHLDVERLDVLTNGEKLVLRSPDVIVILAKLNESRDGHAAVDFNVVEPAP